ncbi:MAG: hypothetical protein ABEJ27_05795 [Halodesulfurarchaeum sp.]
MSGEVTSVEVYVSQAEGTDLTVYHTSKDCPVLPGAYSVMERSFAKENGLRECHRCMEQRYDMLEL